MIVVWTRSYKIVKGEQIRKREIHINVNISCFKHSFQTHGYHYLLYLYSQQTAETRDSKPIPKEDEPEFYTV